MTFRFSTLAAVLTLFAGFSAKPVLAGGATNTQVRIWSLTTSGKSKVTEITRKAGKVVVNGRRLSAAKIKKNQAALDRVFNPKVDGSFFSAPCTSGKYTHHVTRNVRPIVIEGCIESRHGQSLFSALKKL
jgi:hypothetical protein